MAPVIVLEAADLTRLAAIAKNELPNESCAFLLGHSANELSEVNEIVQMANASSSPYSFSINPTDLLRTYEDAESRNLQVVAIFHSHPGAPAPSRTDLKYMELNPVVWLIYSTTEDRFDAYISDGGTKQVELRVRG